MQKREKSTMRSGEGIHLDPALAEGVHHRLRAVVYRQLLQDGRNVVLDRLIADREDTGDLLIAIPVRDQIEDLDLPRGEGGEDGGAPRCRARLAVQRAELPQYFRR